MPIAGIDLAGGIAALGGTEELAIRRGGGPITPQDRDRQGMMRVDIMNRFSSC